ncbi:MAG: hypothetical protein VX017_10845, partial [Pseudomonadota bacterium]|nr:hypothetical protein [Pseudomonadota bacterium]
EVDEAMLDPGWDDQKYLNACLPQIHHAGLPLALFPNGQYFRRHSEALASARGGDPARAIGNGTCAHRRPPGQSASDLPLLRP